MDTRHDTGPGPREPLEGFLARNVARVRWTSGNAHGWATVSRMGAPRSAEVLTLEARRDGWVARAGTSEQSFEAHETPSGRDLSEEWLSDSDRSFDEALCTARSWTALDLAAKWLGIPPPEAERPTPGRSGALRDACLRIADAMFPRDTPLLAWLGGEAAAMARAGALGLRGAAFYAGAGTAARRRRQAAAVAPWMAGSLPGMRDIADRVDAGQPFREALAAAARFGASHEPAGTEPVSPSTLRRMAALDGFVPEARAVARCCRGLLPEWLPRDAAGWDALSLAAFPADILSRQLGLDPRTLLAPARGDWAAYAATLTRVHGVDADPDRTSEWQVSHVRDSAAHLAGTLVDPLLHACGERRGGGRPHRLAARMMFGGLGLGSVLERTARHHAQVVPIERALPREGGTAAWPALFATVDAGEGLEVACLTSAAQLLDEGAKGTCPDGSEGMDHCVVVHATGCLGGWTHIASVRGRAQGTAGRVATARFEVESGMLVLREARGRGNAAPPAEALRALGTVVAMAGDGRLRLSPPTQGIPDTGDGSLWDRYEPSFANLSTALDAWRPLLAMPFARADVDDVAAALGLPSVRPGPGAGAGRTWPGTPT